MTDERVPDGGRSPVDGPEGPWLTPGVLGVGTASLLSDSGHELATSLLPSLLTSTLHAGPAALGTIEGVSDALIGLSKLAGGPLSNDPARRARVATSGYLGTAVATAAIGLAVAVWQVAALRAIAWISRGIRSPARDSLLVSLVPRSAYGRAVGVERAGDNLGAVIGPLLAALLVGLVGIRHAIFFAIVPGIGAAIAITVAGREARRALTAPTGRRALGLNLAQLRSAGLVRALAPAALFELGNMAATLLILRATELLSGGSFSLADATTLAIVLYSAHNAAAAVTSLAGGHAIDRFNPRVVFATGAALYVVAYGLFAWNQHGWPILLLGFLVAGAGIGLGETAQSTVVALLLPDNLRGSGYGALGLVQSVGALGSSLVVGVLWVTVSATAGFLYAAVWMAASVLASGMLRGRSGPQGDSSG